MNKPMTQADIDKAIEEIDEIVSKKLLAIEQAEKQEPFGYFQLDLRMDAWVQNRDNKKGVPFFTAPPLKREWVGLSDNEKQAAYLKIDAWTACVDFIEAKLKEKNT
jgi:hypothetical protein